MDGSRLNASNIEITDNAGKGVLGIASTMIVDNALISNNKGAGFAFGNGARLDLSSSTVSNNEARFGGGITIENSGISTITNSIIENNTATETGGGISAAINSFADITNSVISGNSAPLGSAIETFDFSKATIKDVYVTGNTGSEQFEGDIEYLGSNVDNPFGQEPEGDIGYTSFVVEEPITEEPVVEEPVIEEPVIEEPVVEEPVTEEPVVEEPITEEPVIEEPVLSLDMTEVHRFYQYEKGFHFYTADMKESSVIQQETAAGNLNYDYEGESFAALASNTDSLTGEAIEKAEKVYRFYNSDTGAHLFTMFEAEKEYIESTLDNYTYEGIAYYAFESEQADIDTIPVYRMLNGDTGTHLFSTDTNEIGHIQDNLPNFTLEGDNGVAFYVMEV